MALAGNDPAPGRAGHPPGICSCFLKTASFIFLRLGLSSDGSPEGMVGGWEGGYCTLEKHLLSRHGGLWCWGQRWREEEKEGKHSWYCLSWWSCSMRAVQWAQGSMGEWGRAGGMHLAVSEQVRGQRAVPVPSRWQGVMGTAQVPRFLWH